MNQYGGDRDIVVRPAEQKPHASQGILAGFSLLVSLQFMINDKGEFLTVLEYYSLSGINMWGWMGIEVRKG